MEDFLNAIEEFCGENYIWALTGMVVLLFLVIAVITGTAVKASKRKKAQAGDSTSREYFLEGEYEELLKQKSMERNQSEEIKTHTELTEELSEDLTEKLTEQLTEEEEYKPEDELKTLSERPVCININIEHGQVKIGYDEEIGYDETGQISYKTEAHAEEIKKDDETTEAAPRNEIQESDAEKEIIMEKINIIKGAPSGKFGPGNLNTSRSGRVYTEEELRRKIKE